MTATRRPAEHPGRPGPGRCHRRPGDSRVAQALRQLSGRRRHLAHRPRRPVLRAARAVGLRQDDDAADGRRAGGADRRTDPDRWRRHRAQAAVPAAGEHRLPELRALPAHDDLRERRLRPAAPQGVRHRSPGERDARTGRDATSRQAQTDPALGWSAAADRGGPGAGQQAQGAAARRAAGRAGPQAAPADAARAQADPDRGRDHLHPRHP